MEVLQPPQHLLDHLLLGEDGGPEVEGAGLLTKAGAGDDADAGGLQQLEGVEDISWLTCLLGSLNRRIKGGFRLSLSLLTLIAFSGNLI